MQKAILFVGTALAALSASGCTKSAQASVDPAKIEASIRAQEAQWQKDYAAKDVNALAGHYSEDAALGGPGDPLATTDADRRKALQSLVSDPNLKLTFAADRVQVAQSGDYAYSRGHYSMTMTNAATSRPVSSDGSYLTVYKKQQDGSWKAVEDFITPGPERAAAAK
ncbi:MAG: YybH family protein [Sphingomicrobium sp.]